MSERLLCNTNRAIFQPYHGVKGFLFDGCFVCLMVFSATFNNISVISWRSVLLVKETGVPRKKTTDLTQVTDKLYHIMLYTLLWSRFELKTSVVIGTDCIGSYKSNYHTITTTTAPTNNEAQMRITNILVKLALTDTWCKRPV